MNYLLQKKKTIGLFSKVDPWSSLPECPFSWAEKGHPDLKAFQFILYIYNLFSNRH